MTRNLTRLVPLVLFSLTLSISGIAAATYDSVDELPEPDLVVLDRIRDALYTTCGDAPMGWYDLEQIECFLTGDGIAFAVFCKGTVPPNHMLLILLDVDGQVGSVGRRGVTLERVVSAGYEYAIGIYHGQVAVFDVSLSFPTGYDSDLESWKDGHVAYFEVTWDQVGGRPEAVSVLAFAVDENSGAADHAPNQGKATLEIPTLQ